MIRWLFCFLFLFNFAFSQEKKVFLWDKNEKERFELLEDIPDYESSINWTTGKVRTELHFPLSESSPNMGRTVNNNNARIRDELRQSLIKAMGAVRISDLFLLKDYYSMKSDVRYEIIALADRAFYYPLVQRNNEIIGIAELDLYGKNGIASIFNRDIDRLDNIASSNYLPVMNQNPDEDYFDGVVIDADSTFNPSLQMRIYDEAGVLLYGPETVDKAVLDQKGVCEYVTTLRAAFNSERIGSKVFYTIPFQITGRMNTSFVLNNKDAVRLFGNPKTRKLLNQGRVVVVKNLQ